MVALVLLPGMDGTGDLFAPFVSVLPSEIKPVVVRFPCDRPLGYRQLEVIARASLPRNEPYFLLGESFSGPLAISLAAQGLPGVRGLILCASFCRYPIAGLRALRGFAGLLPLRAIPDAVLGAFLFGRFGSRPLRAMLRAALDEVSPGVLQARAGDVLSIDVSNLASRLDVPVLCLRALEDRVVPRSAGREVKR